MPPIKRALELQPLSRQHHNGLLFCLLLEKGVKKPADKIIMRDFCMYFWEEDLKHHFELEEKYLSSFISYAELKEGIQKMMNDHLYIRKFFEQPDLLTEYSIFDQLQTLLEKHIRFEERELFPLIQSNISSLELHELGHAFENELNNNCSVYPVKFWE
jgi:hemerythrin-like domain-containing protein